MTAEEFEAAYAERSNVSVEKLRALGQVVRPCDCGEGGCEGWQMASVPLEGGRTMADPAQVAQDLRELSKVFYEDGRAQGRAEILALVAKLPSPWLTYKDCASCDWCEVTAPLNDDRTKPPHPDNGCLFVRAQQAAREEM